MMSSRTAVGLVGLGLTGLVAGCIRYRAKDINFFPLPAPADLTGTDRTDWDDVERTMNAMYLLRQGMLDRYNSLGVSDDKIRDCIRPKIRSVDEIFQELREDRWRFQNATNKGNEPTREKNLNRIRDGSQEMRKLGIEADQCRASHIGASVQPGGDGLQIAGSIAALLLLGALALLRRGRVRNLSALAAGIPKSPIVTRPVKFIGGWGWKTTDGAEHLVLSRRFQPNTTPLAPATSDRLMRQPGGPSLCLEFNAPAITARLPRGYVPTGGQVLTEEYFSFDTKGLAEAYDLMTRYRDALARATELDPLTAAFLRHEAGVIRGHLEWIAANMFEGARLA